MSENYALLQQNDENTLVLRINYLLGIIQRPWWGNREEILKDVPLLFSGFLYLQRKRYSKFKRYHCTLKGGRLTFSKKSDSQFNSGSFNILFSKKHVFTKDERERLASQSIPQMSSFCLNVFTENSIVSISAQEDNQLEEVSNSIDEFLSSKYSEQIRDEQSQASDELDPLILEKVEIDFRKVDEMISLLAWQGLAEVQKPLKQGHLRLLTSSLEDNVWKKYFFQLHKKALYYASKDKTKGKGVIALRYAKFEPVSGLVSRSGQNINCFKIWTPFFCYYLRGKHEVASATWIEALCACQQGKPIMLEQPFLMDETERNLVKDHIETSELDQLSVPPYTKPILEWKENNKKTRTFKIKSPSITIGRSSANNLTLEDKNISRQHCRIDTKKNICEILDLGSTRGTSVNGDKIVKKILSPGDRILLGGTELIFNATLT